MPKGKTDVLHSGLFCRQHLRCCLKGKRDVLLKAVWILCILAIVNSSRGQSYDTVIAIVEPPAPEKEKVRFDKIASHYVPAFKKRKVDNSTLTQLQHDEDFWYANQALQKKEPRKNAPPNFLMSLMQEKWFKTLLWILILASFTGVIVWYLSSLNIRLFRRQAAVIPATPNHEMPADIFSIPYDKSIAAAVQQNNFRLAVRLLYLQALMRLSQKALIQFKQDSTNSQYLMQLYNTAYYKDFFKLTRSFEYTWYGQFALSRQAFELVQKDFETFNRQLP